MKTFKIKLDIYNHDLRVACVDSFDEMKAYLKKENVVIDDITSGEAITISGYDVGRFYIIFFPKDNKIRMQHIAHETFHFTSQFLQYLGMSLDNSSEEAFAYLNGYVNETIFDKLNKLGYKLWLDK